MPEREERAHNVRVPQVLFLAQPGPHQRHQRRAQRAPRRALLLRRSLRLEREIGQLLWLLALPVTPARARRVRLGRSCRRVGAALRRGGGRRRRGDDHGRVGAPRCDLRRLLLLLLLPPPLLALLLRRKRCRTRRARLSRCTLRRAPRAARRRGRTGAALCRNFSSRLAMSPFLGPGAMSPFLGPGTAGTAAEAPLVSARCRSASLILAAASIACATAWICPTPLALPLSAGAAPAEPRAAALGGVGGWGVHLDLGLGRRGPAFVLLLPLLLLPPLAPQLPLLHAAASAAAGARARGRSLRRAHLCLQLLDPLQPLPVLSPLPAGSTHLSHSPHAAAASGRPPARKPRRARASEIRGAPPPPPPPPTFSPIARPTVCLPRRRLRKRRRGRLQRS